MPKSAFEELTPESRFQQIAANQAAKFELALVFVNPDDSVQGPHYLGNPFQREPEFGIASVNYKIAELLKRAKGNA
jgi:hypothetical protein